MCGKSIRYHRLLAGLSQEDLSRAAGVPLPEIISCELDTLLPSGNQLEAICRTIGISTATLLDFRDGPVSISAECLRDTDDFTQAQCEAIVAQVEEAANRHIAAAAFAGIAPLETSLPDTPPPLPSSPDEAAAYMRSILGLPASGPIGNLTHVVENAGIIVVPVSGAASGFSSFSVYEPTVVPIIAYSAALCGHRQRCAIARSLIHLAFDISLPTEEQARTAIDIVGRFLLPGTDLKRELGAGRKHIGRAEVNIICAKYGVLRQYVALRALDECIISNEDCIDIMGDYDVCAAATERPLRLTQFVVHIRTAVCTCGSQTVVVEEPAENIIVNENNLWRWFQKLYGDSGSN